MSRWLRIHVGMSEDAKFRLAARNAGVTVRDVMATALCLFEDAAAEDHRGVATRGLPYFAIVLDLEETTLSRIIAQLAALHVVSETPAGIEITNWSKRQFEGDRHDPTNAIRQQRYRDRHRTNGANGNVTASSVMRNESRNGARNGTKHPEAETETDLARTRAGKKARATWTGAGEKWIAKIGERSFDRTFNGCLFLPGPPVTLKAPKEFRKQEIINKYGQALVDVFGDNVSVVVGDVVP